MYRFSLVVLFFACLIQTGWAGESSSSGTKQAAILRELEQQALAANLGLRAVESDLRASQAAYAGSRGIYDPVASFEYEEQSSSTPVNGASTSLSRDDRLRQFDWQLRGLVSTGAELGVGVFNLRQNASPAPRINPAYESQIRFDVVQPLLKGMGTAVVEKDILLAAQDRNLAVEDLRKEAFKVLSEVRDTYFDLQKVRDNLRYRETSVGLAKRVLEENRQRVKAGTLPPVEELEAEVALSERERDLIDADRTFRDTIDALALLLNSSQLAEVGEAAIERTEFTPDEKSGFESAIQMRPELLSQEHEIGIIQINERVAQNQLWPSLDLSAGYGLNGLGADYSEDFRGIRQADYDVWNLGLKLSYPLGNREAKNLWVRTQVQARGAKARLADLRAEVRNAIRSAARQIQIEGKKIDVSTRGRELAEEKLRILLKRHEVGLATTRQVFEGEQDLARARSQQVESLAEYNKAITAYLVATGQLLQHEGISIAASIEPLSDQPLMEIRDR